MIQVSGPFVAAGWAEGEFEPWWDALCQRHPARGKERLGRSVLIDIIVGKGVVEHRGKPLRTWIEQCHAAYCATKNWRGGYAPLLVNWLIDETWKLFPNGATEPADPPKYECETCFDTGMILTGSSGADLQAEPCSCERGKVTTCKKL